MAIALLTTIDRLLEEDRNEQALRCLDERTLRFDQSARRVFALIGLGRIEAAVQTLQTAKTDFAAKSSREQAEWKLAEAALLHATNRVSEALLRYEDALIPLRYSRSRLFLRGRIWRELALADFNDFQSIANLHGLINVAKNRGDAYLTAVATTFWLLAKRHFHQSFEASDRTLAQAIAYPGLRLQALHAVDPLGITAAMFDGLEGLKGQPWTVTDVAPNEWKADYLDTLTKEREAAIARLFPHLPDTPLMKTMTCAHCDNRCCYDGVYVTAKEEAAINELRSRYPRYFKAVPKDFLEEGEWGFLFQGKRTKLRPHDYTKPDYPNHFGKTKCVLALPNGECAPQRAGADHLYHPWKYKPEICWKFPLIGLFNDNAMEKPHYFGEPDPHYFDASQPGYLSFLPCATLDAGGFSWKRVYQHELAHFLLPKE